MTTEQIIQAVSEATGVSIEKMKYRGREHEYVFARQMAQYVIKEIFPEMPLVMIARLFNQKDHTTIIYAIERTRDRMDTETHWQSIYAAVNQKLGITENERFKLLQEDYEISIRKDGDTVIMEQENSLITITKDNIRQLYLSTLM